MFLNKKVPREELRGAPLDKDCKYAFSSTSYFGAFENRELCCGLFEDMKTGKKREKCLKCGAYFKNCKVVKVKSIKLDNPEKWDEL